MDSARKSARHARLSRMRGRTRSHTVATRRMTSAAFGQSASMRHFAPSDSPTARSSEHSRKRISSLTARYSHRSPMRILRYSLRLSQRHISPPAKIRHMADFCWDNFLDTTLSFVLIYDLVVFEENRKFFTSKGRNWDQSLLP